VTKEADQKAEDFRRLWLSVESRVLAAAVRLVRNPDLARDMVQDVALRALLQHRVEPFKDEEHLRRFILRGLRWRTVDSYRSIARRRADSSRTSNEIPSPASQEASVFLNDVVSKIEELPRRQRDVLRLTFGGFTAKEIAEKLVTKPSTIRSLLRTGRAKLVELIGDADEERKERE